MIYMDVKSSQRFIAYFIDILIISIISSIILKLIPFYNQCSAILTDYYNDILFSNNVVLESELIALMKYYLVITGIQYAVLLPLYILYFVVLPLFWDKQTIGRMVMHINVVNMAEEKPSVGSLLLREIVGGFIILRLLSGSIIILVLYWYFSSTRGRTISDMIAKTRLVDTRFINPDADKEKSDFIDAEYQEANDNNDTEYKVF